MNHTDHPAATLQEILSENLLADAYDLRSLADWCKRSYPALAVCRDFRKQLLYAIQHPGFASPKDYEVWTDDEEYPTQELLQAHFKNIWNMCFPDEAIE
jgi:hypothetical protein